VQFPGASGPPLPPREISPATFDAPPAAAARPVAWPVQLHGQTGSQPPVLAGESRIPQPSSQPASPAPLQFSATHSVADGPVSRCCGDQAESRHVEDSSNQIVIA